MPEQVNGTPTVPEENPDIHLQRLLMKQDSTPIWVRVFQDIKELVHPAKLPPLQVTSKPVDPKELKGLVGLYGGNAAKTNTVSMLIHVGVVALLILISQLKPVQKLVANVTPLFAPPPEPVKIAKGGGGGGARQPIVHKDNLPKPTPRAFTPPTIVQHQSAIEAPVFLNADVPDVNPSMGAQNGLSALFGGSGAGGGIGKGYGGGIGNGKGNGVGDGSGGGSGGGMRIGNGVSAPKPIYTPEPEYSEEARKAKFQGTVLLSIVVDETGKATKIQVSRALGLGLDEKAIEAVKKWRFEPGKYNGKPVAVQATVEVSFRLL